MALGLPVLSSNTHSHSSLFQKNTEAKKHTRVGMNAHICKHLYMDARTHTHTHTFSLCQRKRRNQVRTCSGDGRQSWIRDGNRYCCNNAAMADLQISLFRAQPFAQMKPKLQIHPSRYQGLDQYANVSSQLPSPTLIQYEFLQERPRLLQN